MSDNKNTGNLQTDPQDVEVTKGGCTSLDCWCSLHTETKHTNAQDSSSKLESRLQTCK